MRITLRTITDVVRKYVRPLEARLNNAIARGMVKDLDDTTGLARGQSSTVADQVADDIEFIGPYGLSFRPANGAESIVWSIGAGANHLLGMIFDRRVRLKDTLDEGEVALHVGVAGQVVHLKKDGSVVVRGKDVAGAAGGTVTLTAGGDVVATPAAGKKVLLGSSDAADFVALAALVKARLDGLKIAFNTWVPVAMDGGNALKTNPDLVSWLAESNNVAAGKVKAE